MAKFSRFDPRNKKNGRHKNKSRNEGEFKRIKMVKPILGKFQKYYESDSDDEYTELNDST